MKLSELYGMQTEKINGKRRGTVLGAAASGGKIEYLFCCDENENEFTISVDRIISLDERLVYECEGKKIPRRNALRIGAICCDERGKILGRTEDFTLNGYSLKSARIGGKNYAFGRLICGDVVIVKDKAQTDVSATIAARDMFIGAICS